MIVLQNTICEGTDDHCENDFVVFKDHRVCVPHCVAKRVRGVSSEDNLHKDCITVQN